MQYIIAGKELICSHCGGNDFEEGITRLNTSFFKVIDSKWFDQTARFYHCTKCGRMEWFIPVTDPIADDTSNATECLSCGQTIPAGETSCSFCGWNYKGNED